MKYLKKIVEAPPTDIYSGTVPVHGQRIYTILFIISIFIFIYHLMIWCLLADVRRSLPRFKNIFNTFNFPIFVRRFFKWVNKTWHCRFSLNVSFNYYRNCFHDFAINRFMKIILNYFWTVRVSKKLYNNTADSLLCTFCICVPYNIMCFNDDKCTNACIRRTFLAHIII